VIRLKYLRASNFKSLRDVNLAFPDAGSILIEGLNESGKSTLFEAVYFALYGRPLVAESGIESTIRYGAQLSFVELGLMVDATEMVIARHTRVGRQNRAKLTITRLGEPPEVVAALAAINRRIVDELHLDGETLLNSCFVEQKKLQRLEGLTAADRRSSLLRLLNLEGLTRLEGRFKVTGKDEEAIQLATQQRDLARIRADIPAREADLSATERRLAARRILTALDRITAHRAAIDHLELHRGELQQERDQLQLRLDRILALGQVDLILAGIAQTEARRRTEAGAEERARIAIDEVARVRDVELPQLLERLGSVQELIAHAERLETIEAAIAALHDGATAWAEATELQRRAAALEGKCTEVDAQLSTVTALHLALQQADTLIERIQQLDRARSTVDGLSEQHARLDARAQALPAEREHAAALAESATTLGDAETLAQDATRRHDLLVTVEQRVNAAVDARTERQKAASNLELRSSELQLAEAELKEARAALVQSPVPVLRTWIRAHASADRADEARRDEPTAMRELESAEAEQRRASAATAAASARGALLVGGGAVAAISGVGVLAGLSSLVGILLLAVGVVLAALGVRTLATRGRLAIATEAAHGQVTAAQQRLTDVQAAVAAAAESLDQMQEAESILRDLGQVPPGSLGDARQRLATAQANEVEHDKAQVREQDAAAEAARLSQVHISAQVRLGSANTDLSTAERDLDAARQAAAVGADADLAQLLAAALNDAKRARDKFESVRTKAAGLLDEPTPERMRIEVAGARRAIEEVERQVSELPTIAQRLAGERERMAGLESTSTTERQKLRQSLPGLGIEVSADELDAARTALEQRLRTFDEVELRRTQTRLNTEIGGARETAQRQHEAAARAWESARKLAGDSVARTGEESLTIVARDVVATATCAEQASASLTAEIERLRSASKIERSRLVGIASALGEPLRLQRLRAAESELGMQQRQMDDQVARLPSLQEEHARAAATLSRTDSELERTWSEVEGRLDTLGLSHAERIADPLRHQVAAELRVLDEQATRGRLDRVIGEISEAAETIRQRQDRVTEDQCEIAHRLADVAIEASGFEYEQLVATLPELDEKNLPDERVLTEGREALLGDISHLKAAQRELETQLDLVGVPLDLAQQDAALATLVRTREIKKRATRIITTARTRMIDRVLPGTEQNLRLLLPGLTAERYIEAKLDSEYRLSVWDAAAQRYVAKDIFSGGTRDQFSLALRLAFALATLPQELGTTPGFIFLDEPLSAFDHPRTAALVDLLTQGQIAKSFAQIFLISHSRSFDPDLFPYYVRMEEGRVAETNLPSLAADGQASLALAGAP
jgi:DNA repair exonuclease SbcCD ATPase subunit